MNFRFTKQRASHSETHNKKSDNTIQLSQFFSRPSNDFTNRINNIYYDPSQKQNKNPNLEPQLKNNKQKGDKITPKKKVIHLKSITRNSKSNKNANSGSMDKKYYHEHPYMEVTDFSDDSIPNRPSITIDVDLKSHRRSMQDTLVSSNTLNQFIIKNQEISCCSHIGKKATFMVKGSPYCDKCSVKLITKGYVAVKIKQQKDMKNSSNYELYKPNQKQTRDFQLKSFIQELDKMQPILQSIGSKLNSYTGWMTEYCIFQYDKFQQNWDKFIKYLQDYKKHIITNFKAQEQKANKMLQQNKIKITQQTQNLTFMRNDIVRNIDRIIDQKIIRDENYDQVMKNFKLQLQEINQNVIQIQKSNLVLPRVQFDAYQLDQQLHKFLFIKPFAEQLFSLQNLQTPSVSSARKDSDPYRLSFGKQPQRIQSPTFKVI